MAYCLNRKTCKLQCVLSKISLIVTLKLPLFDNIFISRQNRAKSSFRADRNLMILLLLTPI